MLIGNKNRSKKKNIRELSPCMQTCEWSLKQYLRHCRSDKHKYKKSLDSTELQRHQFHWNFVWNECTFRSRKRDNKLMLKSVILNVL